MRPARAGAIFWRSSAAGLAGVALASLLARDGLLQAAPVPGEAADLPPHHPPKAKRAIQIFLSGGLSQVDSFDYKPALEKYHGQPLPSSEKPDVFFGQVGLLHQSHWAFKQRGQSGLWMSELFPHLAECADQLDLCPLDGGQQRQSFARDLRGPRRAFA